MASYFTKKELDFYNSTYKHKYNKNKDSYIKKDIPKLREKLIYLANKIIEDLNNDKDFDYKNNFTYTKLGKWLLYGQKINEWHTIGIIDKSDYENVEENKRKVLFFLSVSQKRDDRDMSFNIRIGSYKYNEPEDDIYNEKEEIFYDDLIEQTEEELIVYCSSFIKERMAHYIRYLKKNI